MSRFRVIRRGHPAGSIPANTVAPTITGDPVVGQLLFTSDGTWTGTPTSYAYQWYKDGSAASGETYDNYLIQDADVGSVFKCRVTATNASGSASADSANTPAATDISLTSAITAFTRTSSSGVTPMTWNLTFGSNVYEGYTLRAKVYSDNTLTTLTQEVEHLLTNADLQSGATIDLSGDGLTSIGATDWLQLTVETTSPNGIFYFYTHSTALSPTDAPAATVWSATNSDASFTGTGTNTVTSTVSGDRMAKADHGHSGTGDWSYTLTPSQSGAHMVGLSNLTQATNTWVGNSANSIGWRNTDGTGFGTGGVNAGFTWISSDVITVRLKNNKLYLAKNGTYISGTNPTTEVGGIDVSSKGTLYPAVSTNASGNSYPANFTNWP